MFSLRSISLFALAFTAITSAAPTVDVARRDPKAPGGGSVISTVTGKTTGPVTTAGGSKSTVGTRDEPHKSFPDIFNAAHTGLGPIVASLG